LKEISSDIREAMLSLYPCDIELTYDVILSFVNSTFVLEGEYYRKDRDVQFKGKGIYWGLEGMVALQSIGQTWLSITFKGIG